MKSTAIFIPPKRLKKIGKLIENEYDVNTGIQFLTYAKKLSMFGMTDYTLILRDAFNEIALENETSVKKKAQSYTFKFG